MRHTETLSSQGGDWNGFRPGEEQEQRKVWEISYSNVLKDSFQLAITKFSLEG